MPEPGNPVALKAALRHDTIRRAIEVRAHVVEIDVRTSKDGVLFLLHDSTLDRTTDGTGPANERTMAELKELDGAMVVS